MVRNLASLNRIRTRLAAEDGVALIFALVASLALGATVTSAVAFSAGNSRSASHSTASQQTLALAEAGINNAMAVIGNPANNPTNPNLLPATSAAYEGGSVTWSGTYDSARQLWKLTATGEMRSPTGATAPVRRTVTAEVPVAADAVQPLQQPSWNFMVSTRTSLTCDMTMNSDVSVGSPLYVMGDLCLSSTARITSGPLNVRGNLTMASTTNSVGTTAAPLSEAHIAGSCKYASNAAHSPCSAADNVHARVLDALPTPLTPPTPEWDKWYAEAAPGPKSPCTTASGTPPVFENEGPNGARNLSVTAVQSLTPTTSYTCKVGSPDNPRGELSWNASTKVLTVKGTIFVDGSIKIDNGALNTYQGQGVIYTSGTFVVMANSKMCAVAGVGDCDFTRWDPNTTMLAVVSNGNGGSGVLTGNSVQIGCFDRFQGGLFATNAVAFASGAKHQGPIVAGTITLSSGVQTFPFPALTKVPAGIPGNPISSVRAGRPVFAE